MLDPRDADPVTLPLKTQARVESAALAADDCLAGQSLPLLPALAIPKIPTRIRLLTLQTMQSGEAALTEARGAHWGCLQSFSRVPALERALPLPGAEPGSHCAGAAPLSLPQRGREGFRSSRGPAGFRCAAAWTHASHWQQETGCDPATAKGLQPPVAGGRARAEGETRPAG